MLHKRSKVFDMTTDISGASRHAILLVGASRGLGLAMAREFVKKGWNVLGTVQSGDRTELHDLADQHPDRVEIQSLDITEPAQILALRDRLAGRHFDMLFNNAGTANRNQDETIADVSTEEFIHVMVTNALSPMRVIETLQDLVPTTGLLGIMSSGQGSVSDNNKGGHEVYRGTKSALNQYMRSFAARHAHDPRALILIAPGWVRTDLGGPDAPLSIDQSIPKVVEVLLAQIGKPGLQYLDRDGKTVPW
jgi:NAD(P)-dependent dehydrogenase (short-subunit alcohol dehydrogenase family)